MKLKNIIDIIKTSSSVILATINKDNEPECRAVFNLANCKKFPNLKTISVIENDNDSVCVYIGTNTSSKKVEQLRKNNNCSLYYVLPDKISGVNLCGTTEEITDLEIKKKFWQPTWFIYYHKGVGDPDFTLLKFTSKKIKCWSNGSLHEF